MKKFITPRACKKKNALLACSQMLAKTIRYPSFCHQAWGNNQASKQYLKSSVTTFPSYPSNPNRLPQIHACRCNALQHTERSDRNADTFLLKRKKDFQQWDKALSLSNGQCHPWGMFVGNHGGCIDHVGFEFSHCGRREGWLYCFRVSVRDRLITSSVTSHSNNSKLRSAFPDLASGLH